MKQVIVSEGIVRLDEVPAPLVAPGTVLVKMDHSCISVGTEMSGVKATGRSIVQRALQQPKNVKKVIDMVRSDGLTQTMRLVQDRLSVELPTGYSGAGIVAALGDGVFDFKIGDRVACAGAQCAFHAEYVCIPTNLVVAVPDDVTLAEASTVALGAIALQGVRRAAPTLGETFVVVGLGFIGQLTAQMLRANGCRVIGIDLDRERLEHARSKGLDWAMHPTDVDEVSQVSRLTAGVGADGVIITAASQSSEIVSAAFRMCRKKARVVLVGDVGLDLNRADFYVKELDFLISSSYGPGRYDERYEEGGLDYPVAYVRWTEGRNMAEYLRLISDKLLDIGSMVSVVYPLERVDEAYRKLQAGPEKPLLVLLSYQSSALPSERRIVLPVLSPAPAGRKRIGIGLIGAGGFAKGMHLPNIAEMKEEFELRAIASRTGHNAASTAKRFGAQYCTTDFSEILRDPDIDAVIIATRHDSHTALALDALRAGKHVLLEKPLALTADEILKIQDYYENAEAPHPLLFTGFNRRFSPIMERVAAAVAGRSNPMMINYRMNAGYIPLDHWVHGAEGGGRNRGEACHIYDLFTFLTQSKVATVDARAIRPSTAYYSASDNFIATITFEDGSVATLTYTALGATAYPKETMEIFFDGSVIGIDDYRSLRQVGGRTQEFALRKADKGQKKELSVFAEAIKSGGAWPIPLWQQIQATMIAIDVDAAIQR